MSLQDGPDEAHQTGGWMTKTKVDRYQDVPSPRTLKLLIWEDGDAELELFHSIVSEDMERVHRICFYKKSTRKVILDIMNHIEEFHGDTDETN